MSLSDRLKRVRESLGYTQKEMAKAILTNPQTWQVYEAGKSVPGGNVLEALARMGFNVNWILTGEGVMKRESTDGWWSEKMKEIRGAMTIPELVEKAGFEDKEAWLINIQAVEDKKMDADIHLINVLTNELGINVDWLFGWPDAPMQRAQRVSLSNYDGSNLELDTNIMDAINRLLNEKSRAYGELSGGKTIIIMNTIYRLYSRNFIESNKFRIEAMEKTIDALFRLALPMKEQEND